MAFSPKSETRISETVQRSETTVGNPRSRRGRWHRHKNSGTPKRWGKLDEDVAAGDSDAVVSLWRATDGTWAGWDEDSTENQEDVWAPPWLEAEGTADSPTFPSGAWVLIEKINGRWVIVHCWKTQTVVTELQVDGPNKELEKMTRQILVMPTGDESEWEVWHTGEECSE